MKVLLVEDVEVEAKRIEAMLRNLALDLELSRVSTLSAGIQAAREGVDQVLLDLTLDDSLGIGTLVKFRKECPNTPVVVITGEKDELIREEALNLGANAYLIKNTLKKEDLKAVLVA